MPPKNDFTNIKIHKLTFIRETSKRSWGSVLWEAICDCGNTHITVPDGKTKTCGCSRLEAASKIAPKNRKYSPRISSARAIWRAYNECDFDVFLELTQKPCFYCGSQPSNSFNLSNGNRDYNFDNQKESGTFIYNGLDRVDSSKGHTIDNIVPCCIICNRAKNALSLQQFVSHIEKLSQNL
jgi:hypothetical protein